MYYAFSMGKQRRLTGEEKQELLRLTRGRNTPQKVALRSKIVLLADEGVNKRQIAEGLDTTRPTVYLWLGRFAEGGVDSLKQDASRPGRKPALSSDRELEIVEATLSEKPPNATHWSVRTMAEAKGVSRMTVHRVWKKYNLKPHLQSTFKISNDPHFAEKLQDIVGLYMNPPEKALVLSVDEKSQIQALDRTQPGLPMKPGKAGTMTHDYKRNGTTTLFAALNVLEGNVIGDCMPRHRAEEFLRFLRKIDKLTPRDLDVHLIVDNYGTHKTAKVNEWLSKHPRFHMHFTPTSSSWLNAVEGFFSQITSKRIKRGAFRSVAELKDAIGQYIDKHNENPRPFVWTKGADVILDKVNACKEALGTVH